MSVKTARTWFMFSNQVADLSVAEIQVVDIIGDWIDELINEYYGMKATLTAKGFLDQLSKLDAGVKTIRVFLNTPGGDVFAALNIANALRDQQLTKGRTVETIVTGLAASAGSIIAMAGSKVIMADNALMMIHQPWSGSVGNAKQMRADADTLDTITKALVSTYQWHSELTDAEIVALLDGKDGADGTWLTADEAIANGLATDKQTGLQAAASIDARAAAAMKVPAQYRDRVAGFFAKSVPAPTLKPVASAIDVVKACKAAGFPEMAEAYIELGYAMSDVTDGLATAKAAKAEATARETNIRAVCATAGLEAMADGYVKGGMPLESVKAHITTVTAVIDRKTSIDTKQPIANATGARTSGNWDFLLTKKS
jgi:ATP-dependent Clp protease, protease subunit